VGPFVRLRFNPASVSSDGECHEQNTIIRQGQGPQRLSRGIRPIATGRPDLAPSARREFAIAAGAAGEPPAPRDAMDAMPAATLRGLVSS
jgi:hypothetical protein